MTNRFVQDAKLLFTLMKLYRFAYIPEPAISMINLAASALASNVAIALINGTATATTALFAYLVVASVIAIASHYYAKRELFKEVEFSLSRLFNGLGEILVALLSGTQKQADVRRWLRRYKVPTRPQIERLKFAYEIFCSVSEVADPEQVRWWFVSANTGSDEISPAEAIRQGRFEDVRISAAKVCRPFQDRDHQG